MYLSDSTLHSAIDGISRTLGIYVEVEGAEYAPASIIRLEWENECIEGSNFTIGGTLSNRIELEIYHDSSISVGDQIKPSVEIEVEGIMQRIPLGVFYVDDVVVNKEITTLTAYDAMISLNEEYVPSANHKTLKALASDVCQQAGIMMKGTVENISIKGSLSGYSYRETLGFIASFHGGNMVVDRDGQFKIKTYEEVDRTIPNHAYFSFDQKDTYRVSGVMCNFGDVGVGRGDDTAQCVTFENPYVTDAHMDAIYLKLKDLTFVAGTLKYRGDMNLDAGDLFKLTDANGQDHLLLCGQNQLTFTGGLTGTLISIGEGQGANQYVEYQFKNKKSLTQLTVEMGSIQAKISEVENKIEGDLVTSEEMSSAIEMAKDSIELGVSSQITEGLSNMQIGANNLLLNSSFEYDTKYWDISDSDYIFPMPNGYDGGQCLKINGSLNATRRAKNTCSGLIPDTEYTFSGYIRTMDLAPGATNYLLGFIIAFFKNGNWMDEIYCREPSTGTHWFKKRTVTFRTPSYDQCDTVVISCYGRDFTGSVWFDHLKLTQGNKESDWSPAPTELADRITDTEASIKINTDNIALKASKTDVQNLTNRVTTAESKITDTAITNVVKNNFYTKDQADSSFATQTQLEQTATDLTATIKQSNGYNELLNGSFDTRDFSNWTVTASDAGVTQHAATLRYRARVKCVSGVNRGFQQTVRLLSGQWYTVSTNVVVDSGVVAGVEVSYNGKYFGTRTNNSTYFSKGILHYTFQADENTDANVLFYVDGKSYGDTGAGKNAYFYYVQLEKGQIATTFSPHPNEIYTTNAIFDKNGLRVNQTNIGTYTRMGADGFFVMKNNGNVLFEATDKIALYDGKGSSCVTIVNDPSASYGNAKIDLRGGINFIHNTGASVGTNQILLGNDDRADKYGFHNLSIRAHNSLGFQDNNGYTHMYFATRTGRIIMKGALYQNATTPPSAFFLSTDENDDLYFSGYTKQDMIDAILELDTQIQLDNEEDYTMKICPSENDLITTMIGDQPHIDQSSLIAGLVETVKMLNERITLLDQKLEKTSK